MLTRVLSMLPSPRIEDSVTSRVEAVVAQCSLSDLSTLSAAVAKWMRNDHSSWYSAPNRSMQLLQTLNHCGHERLQTADRLDALLEELKYISGEWFAEVLMEKMLVVLQRMTDQINWTNAPQLAFFLNRMNHLCPPLMDRIASVTIKDIEKVCFFFVCFVFWTVDK